MIKLTRVLSKGLLSTYQHCNPDRKHPASLMEAQNESLRTSVCHHPMTFDTIGER